MPVESPIPLYTKPEITIDGKLEFRPINEVLKPQFGFDLGALYKIGFDENNPDFPRLHLDSQEEDFTVQVNDTLQVADIGAYFKNKDNRDIFRLYGRHFNPQGGSNNKDILVVKEKLHTGEEMLSVFHYPNPEDPFYYNIGKPSRKVTFQKLLTSYLIKKEKDSATILYSIGSGFEVGVAVKDSISPEDAVAYFKNTGNRLFDDDTDPMNLCALLELPEIYERLQDDPIQDFIKALRENDPRAQQMLSELNKCIPALIEHFGLSIAEFHTSDELLALLGAIKGDLQVRSLLQILRPLLAENSITILTDPARIANILAGAFSDHYTA